MAPFGATIPALGLNLGFPGNISREGKLTIVARQVLSTTPNPISFGQACVNVSDALGGTLQSIADFIAGGGTFTAALFAGIAVRNVRTNIAYTSLTTIGTQTVGQYPPGDIAEVMEEGSTTVPIPVGAPAQGAPVYVRTALNGGIPLGLVGDLEAAADGALVGAAFGGNTGNATIGTLSAGAAGVTGVYRVVMTDATHFNVYDPSNVLLGSGVNGTTFVSTAISLKVTTGATPMIAGDGFTVTATYNTVSLGPVGVVFRTGVLDANGIAEITMKNRVAA